MLSWLRQLAAVLLLIPQHCLAHRDPPDQQVVYRPRSRPGKALTETRSRDNAPHDRNTQHLCAPPSWSCPDTGSPRASTIAGMVARPNMVRHEVAGRATLTSRAARMPMQTTSWLTLPNAPRTCVGETWRSRLSVQLSHTAP